MHIHEGVLHPAVLAAGWAITAGGLSFGLKRLPTQRIMHAALLAAGFFVASFIHFSVGAVNVHLTLNALVGLFLGWGAFPVIFTGLLLQALLFNYGGLTVLGVNTAVMALPAVLFGLALHHWLTPRTKPAAPPLAAQQEPSPSAPPERPGITVPMLPVVAAVVATLLCSNLLYVLALAASGKEFYPIARIAFVASLPLMAVEAPITLLVLRSIAKARPAALSLGKHTPCP